MNKVAFILSIAISAIGGYWMGSNHDHQNNTAPSTVFIKSAIPTHPNATTSSDINIEKKVQHGKTLVDQAELLTHKISSGTNQTAQLHIDAIKSEYEFKLRSQSFTNWLIKNLEKKPWFDLGIEMRGQFEAEDIDHYWASDKEEHLRSVFTQEQALAGIAVTSTHCKSTQCQMTISVIDHDHMNEATEAITRVLGGKKFTHIIVDSKLQQGETTFYLSSNEKGFEFN